jgi:hypothetical protein
MTVDSIIALNANAVSLLMGSGNVQGAIDVLRVTLAKLRHSLVPIVDAGDASSCHYTAKDTGSDDVERCTIRSVPTDVDNSSELQDDNTFYLFERAILIEGGYDQILVPTDRLLNRIAVVVTYNLGLAHHLLGLQNGNYKRVNYAKALRFYEMADTLDRMYPDNPRGILFLAVVNNTAHIQSHFFDTRDTQRCLDGISFMLMSNSSDEEKTSEEYRPFYMNVMFYRQTTVASPAA